jgi:hypothetical protein
MYSLPRSQEMFFNDVSFSSAWGGIYHSTGGFKKSSWLSTLACGGWFNDQWK